MISKIYDSVSMYCRGQLKEQWLTALTVANVILLILYFCIILLCFGLGFAFGFSYNCNCLLFLVNKINHLSQRIFKINVAVIVSDRRFWTIYENCSMINNAFIIAI